MESIIRPTSTIWMPFKNKLLLPWRRAITKSSPTSHKLSSLTEVGTSTTSSSGRVSRPLKSLVVRSPQMTRNLRRPWPMPLGPSTSWLLISVPILPQFKGLDGDGLRTTRCLEMLNSGPRPTRIDLLTKERTWCLCWQLISGNMPTTLITRTWDQTSWRKFGKLLTGQKSLKDMKQQKMHES